MGFAGYGVLDAAETFSIAEAEFANAELAFEKGGLAALFLRGLVAVACSRKIPEMEKRIAQSFQVHRSLCA
jgi:hypothetical protein